MDDAKTANRQGAIIMQFWKKIKANFAAVTIEELEAEKTRLLLESMRLNHAIDVLDVMLADGNVDWQLARQVFEQIKDVTGIDPAVIFPPPP